MSSATVMVVGRALVVLALSISSAHAARLHEIDAAAAARWADAAFGQALREQRFTGAAVVIVKDGAILFSRGYGHADHRTGTPMDPATTLVRVCSNSKTFVATGLMQLIDNGTIASLDDPVNKYLERIQLPAFEGRDITLRHLVTHRAGFEDSFFNAGTDRIVETPVDAETLRRLIPEIVRRPGSLSVYSNATAALQGVVIEDLTGLTLRDYLARNVFLPLGMMRTVLNDNPPAPEGHAQPYVLYADGSSRAVETVAKHPFYAASGGVYSTAEDMVRFVMAHLDAGRTATNPILSPAAFDAMHRLAVRNHPRLGGIGVQFFVEDINGARVVSHSCGLPGFSSYLAFMPDSDVGLLVTVVSTREREDPLASLVNCFVDRDEPIPPNFAVKFFYGFLGDFIGFGELPRNDAATPEDLSRFLGSYRPERRTHTNMLAALDLLSPEDSAIVISRKEGEAGGLFIGERGPFISVYPGVLQRDMHPARIYAFDFDETGRAVRMMWSSTQVATRVEFLRDPQIAHDCLIAIALISLTGLLVLFSPVGVNHAERWGRLAPLLVALSLLFAWAFASLGFGEGENIEDYVNVGGVARLALVATACNLAALAALAMSVIATWSWVSGFWGAGVAGLARRVHYSALGLAGLALIPLFASYNLLGFQLP